MSIYWQLIRPGLLSAVLISMFIAASIVTELPPNMQLAHAVLGTALLIAGATAMNQLMERRQDALMTRTAFRPLPSSRMSELHAALFAVTASLAGIGWLFFLEPPAVTLLAAISWGIYVLIYTPLKRVSVWHMPIGALAGAMPVLLGSAAVDTTLTPASLTLFCIIFFWQFPHTAAIGWIYRNQYAGSQTKVASVVDPSGRLAGWLAIFGSVGTLVASLFPLTHSTVGWSYTVSVLVLGVLHMVFAAKFLTYPADSNARTLRRFSLIYLLTILMSLVVERFG